MASLAFLSVRLVPLGRGLGEERGVVSSGHRRVLAGRERFEGGDDAFQVGLDLAQVLGQAGLAVGVGAGDEAAVGRGLAAVDVQEFRAWSGSRGRSGRRWGAGSPAGPAGRSSRWAGCP